MPRGARGGHQSPLIAKCAKCNSKKEIDRVVRKAMKKERKGKDNTK